VDKPLLLLNEMVAFAQVDDHGGFSQAARALGVEPSSMSRSVARLEKALQAKLLLRNSKSISLTELGEQVLAECTRILGSARDVHAMAARYTAAPAGLLRVSAPVAFGQVWLAPRVAGFVAAFPEIDLRLSLVDQPVDLVEDRIDVAIRIAAQLPQDLAARRLCPTPYVLVASPAYLAAQGTPGHPEQLACHRCIHLGYGAFDATWPMRNGHERISVAVSPRYAIGNSLALAAAVEGGAGIGLIPEFSAQAGLADGRLVRVLPQWQLEDTYQRSAWLLYAAGPRIAPKVRAFVDYLVGSAAGPSAGARA